MSKCISKRKKCEEKETPVPLPPCQEVAFCAGNYTISFDGRCLHKSPRAYQIPNGTYSTVTFEDGCIVGVGQVAPAQYTPNECCASPSVDGSDTSSDVQVSSAPANLLKRTPDGLSVIPVFRGQGVSISGTGQPTDPIIISVDPTDTAGAYAISADPTTITVTGKGTSIQDPIAIGLKPVITAGKKGNFTINSYGQIIGYADTGEAVVNVVGESPIKTSKLGDTVRVSLDMDSLWTLLNSRAADDSLNGIAAGSFETRDGKLVSYDRLGRIVSVETIPETGTDDGDAGGTN